MQAGYVPTDARSLTGTIEARRHGKGKQRSPAPTSRKASAFYCASASFIIPFKRRSFQLWRALWATNPPGLARSDRYLVQSS